MPILESIAVKALVDFVRNIGSATIRAGLGR
jgi:hypothetical protein